MTVRRERRCDYCTCGRPIWNKCGACVTPTPAMQALLGLVAFPLLLVAFVMSISPFMNWMAGYGFTWIF